MTLGEFSNGFDTLVSSYMRFKDFDKRETLDSIEFDEFEKSTFLTKAQLEVIVSLYNGKNQFGDSFERTEEMRRYLDSLVKTEVLTDTTTGTPVSSASVFYTLPEDIAFITLEQVTYSEPGTCWDGMTVGVYPVRQDEFDRIRRNPFRGPKDDRVLRLDSGLSVSELVSSHPIASYLVRYVAKPSPIILEDLPNNLSIDGESQAHECEFNPMIHQMILERAVALALNSKRIYTNTTN